MINASRYPMEFAVSITSEGIASTPHRMAGTSLNLSATGLGVALGVTPGVIKIEGEAFQTGEQVNVILHLGEQDDGVRRLILKGKIVWLQRSQCGLFIICMPEDEKLMYEDLISGFKILQDICPLNDLGQQSQSF